MQQATIEHVGYIPTPQIESQTELASQEEPTIQEVTMTEAVTSQEVPIDVTSHDIKDVPDYRVRNRVAQPTNPYFITEKGTHMAGVLMANTPGENKEERINYLAHLFKLSKEERKLIGTTFTKGNYWFTIRFKLHLDMENCVEKLNGKNGEDFKILYLKGEHKKEERTPNVSNISATQAQIKSAIQPGPSEEKRKDIRELKEKETPVQQSNRYEEKKDNTLTSEKTSNNPYRLIEGKSAIGIGMLVGTFPGQNRQEQLAIIAEVFRIPVDNNLINIEHKNGNSWFTGYFKKESERTYCVNKLEEVNKEITNLDETAKDRTFKIIKLEELRTKDKKPRLETNKSETTVQILDIPADFTTSRIKGAIKSYGTVIEIQMHSGKRTSLKSATVTFDNLKIDLDQTWAIPMGEIMARIAPAYAEEEVFAQRNQLTARLYGIGRNCSATRIMSAVKHTGAKTVHIPTNSRTQKKRNFAIIGFQDIDDLDKAITKHIFVFGCKTWWSTKDNTKVLQKQHKEKREYVQYAQNKTDWEADSDQDTEAESSSAGKYRGQYNSSQANEHKRKQENKHKRNKEKKRDTETEYTTKRRNQNYSLENPILSLTSALHSITERLNKLEKRERKGKGVPRS
jgi:RNA recognition motif-containing protein